MKVVLDIDAQGNIRELHFKVKAEMSAQDSPFGLNFDAWYAHQKALNHTCNIISDIPATETKEREVVLEWSK